MAEKLLRASGYLLRSSSDDADRSFRAVLSVGAVARDNHKIDPEGWILPASRAVPLLDSHNDRDGIGNILGRVTDIRVGKAPMSNGDLAPALVGKVVFADESVNPAAEVAYQLYRGEFADSFSVSFIPKTYTYAQDRQGLNISRAELLEVSTVAIPSDVNAKVLGRAIRRRAQGRETSADRLTRARVMAALDSHGEDRARRLRIAEALALQTPPEERERARRVRIAEALALQAPPWERA